MQFSVTINQVKAQAWGLNAQQAMLFAFLYEVPSWADSRQLDGHTYFNIGKGKIVAEMPLLTDKPDTAYRLMKQLAKAGLIAMASCDNKTYMRLLPKARSWNRDAFPKGSEKYPTPGNEEVGSEKNPTSENPPPGVGKISEPGSEKSPTNQATNDQATKDQNPSLSGAREPNVFERAAQQCDDGNPAPTQPRLFPMTLDWQPDPDQLAMACQRAGLSADTQPAKHQLAKFTAHHADTRRQHGSDAWHAKLVDWLRNDQRAAQARNGGFAHDDPGSDQRRDARDERAAVRQQLADPHDTEWADGWWPRDETGPAAGAGAGAGGAGFHPADSVVPEDLGECVSHQAGAGAGAPGAGDGAGDLAGAADPGGSRAGHERVEAAGEYLATDHSCAGVDAGASGRGFRVATGE